MKHRFARRAVVATLLMALSGCGFRPIYARTESGLPGPAAAELASIDVTLMPDRGGQILRQDIQARLERFGIAATKTYKLSVVLIVTQEELGVQPDSSATFVRVRADATWTLSRLDAKSSVVTAGSARAVDGFNVIDLQVFAGELETESVQSKLSQRIADQIALELGIYFQQHSAHSA